MEYINKTKVLLTTFLGALSSFMGVLFLPVILMVFANIIDYATGIMASNARGEEISSYKSIKGIYKKVGMWLLVLTAWIMDMTINYSISTFGIQLNIPAVASFQWPTAIACIMSVWIVVNEIISIVENIRAMGTEVPAFMDKVTDGMVDAIDRKLMEQAAALQEQVRKEKVEDGEADGKK